MAEKVKVISIKETSRHAFTFLLEYIYGTKPKLEVDNAEKLFEILNLAERYDIQRLRGEVTKHLEALRVEEENVLEVARVAEAYHHFEAASASVLLSCSRLLKELFTKESTMTEFCQSRLQFPDDRQMVEDLVNRVEEEMDDEEDIGDAMKDLFQQEQASPTQTRELPTDLYNVNWIELTDPGLGIPPDICFRIVETSGEKNNNSCRVAGEVLAHKYFLAAISHVFRESFFDGGGSDGHRDWCKPSFITGELKSYSDSNNAEGGDLKGTFGVGGMETVDIVCSSLNAFKVMIDYIYGKYPTLRGAEEICEIFEIVDLADRFCVSGLVEEYRTAMFLYFREKPRWNSNQPDPPVGPIECSN
jgi:hypothetical protein